MSKIAVVDENDKPIGEFAQEEVWGKGLLHRIVRIMVEDEQGRILLQKRSMEVDTFPGCWDHSAAGHVDAGEDYEEAAKRELEEELGISNATLHKVAVYRTNNTFKGRKLNRFNALYKATIDSTAALDLQESEVSDAKWFTLDEVRKLIADRPDSVTDGLAQVIADYYSNSDTSSSPHFTLLSFTAGKNPDRNEDVFGSNTDTLVLADGATDKAGIRYEEDTQTGAYKTGGEVAANIVVQTALATDLNGKDLANAITEEIKRYYTKHAPQALEDSAYRFASMMAVARIVGYELVITQIGDVAFRINGKDEYKNDKEIDLINANLRKEYVAKTGDIPGGREHILPRLKEQHKLQNNGEDTLGYGTLDGSPVPEKFIRTFSFPLAEVHILELVTDGYFGAFPAEATIEAYEELHVHIETVDPHKIGDFPSTKTSDDRTVLIAKFGEADLGHEASV